MFQVLARLASRRPWAVVAGAIIFAVVAGAFGGSVASVLKGGGFDDPSSQSVAARLKLEQATGLRADTNLVALVRTRLPVSSAETRREVRSIAQTIRQDPGIGRVLTVYNTHNQSMISRDGKSTYVLALIKPGSDDAAAFQRLDTRLAGNPHVLLGGGAGVNQQVLNQTKNDLGRAELLAFPLLFLLLLWVFRGVIAASLPLLVGVLTILGTFLGLRIVTEWTDLSIFALNLVTGLGLGLSIDYSLFMLSRFREELGAGADRHEAIRRTLTTAGRTVFFSSLTVAAALASLTVFPQRFLYSMGLGGVFVALLASAIALIVLPAVLVLLGPNVNRWAPRRWQRTSSANPDATGFWTGLAGQIMRRPALFVVAGAALLIALGLPFLGIKFTSVDVSVLPKTASARVVDDTLHRSFPQYTASPIIVVAQAPASDAAQVLAFAHRLQALPGVAGISSVQPQGSTAWRIDLRPGGGVFSDASRNLVKAVRAVRAPFPILVGGDTATFVDLQSSLASHLPLAVLIVVAVTLVLLFLVTGSVVLPLKAIVMNALTLSAAFGVLVLIFQDGRLEGLLRYTGQGALESTQPVLLFAIVFGLSTDYSVFLLTRIKEMHDGGADTRQAVAMGLERTGRIVTSAALLFCVAIGAFATSQIVFIKELGVGTAAGVILDATVVRALLVPSLMALLGEWNWRTPRPLRRLHTIAGLRDTEVEPATEGALETFDSSTANSLAQRRPSLGA